MRVWQNLSETFDNVFFGKYRGFLSPIFTTFCGIVFCIIATLIFGKENHPIMDIQNAMIIAGFLVMGILCPAALKYWEVKKEEKTIVLAIFFVGLLTYVIIEIFYTIVF